MAKGPGKAGRKGLTLVEAVEFFSDEAKVEELFVGSRWPDGVACPTCGSLGVTARPTRTPQPFRCRYCGLDFSVKTGSVMHGSKLALGKWGLAIYLLTTNLKGVSSMKLHRDLGVTQKTAWFLAHRIRKAWESGQGLFSGPVEVDETYIGGKWTGKGRGPKGKAPVVGVKDEVTGKVVLKQVANAHKATLQGFIHDHVKPGATVYTDGHGAYAGLKFPHTVVNHSVGEYVNGEATTNGIESEWATLKRGYHGVYHHMSVKHLSLPLRV